MVKGATVRLKNIFLVCAYTLILVIGILPVSRVNADALIDYSSGTVSGGIEDIIDLSGITVSGTDPTIPLVLEIDDSNGILYMTDETGLTFNSSNRASRLSFSGSVTDINNALATLKFRTMNAGSYTLRATIIGAGVVYFPGNGHMYEVVNNGSGLDWTAAQAAAAGRTLNGATGYLATVTTQEENDYLVGRLQGDGWFGATDATVEGDWQWATGPEAGTSFWAGLGNGSPVGGLYSNWSSGEPNDQDGEDCSQFYSGGSGWNDLPCNYAFINYYVVEYGSPGNLPTAPESISFTVNVTEPSADTVPIGSCLDLLDVADNPELDNRYDTLSLTANVDCMGETLAPMFSNEDIDFGKIGFRGTFQGNGFTLSNIDINETVDDVGLFSATNGATFDNFTIGGSVVGVYCVGGLVGEATNTNFTNITSTITVEGYAEVGGIVGCYEAEGDSENMIDEVSATNTLSNVDDSDTGGLIGTFDADDTSQTTIEDSSADSTFITTYSRVGGLIGEIDLYGDSTLNIHRNTINSVDSVDSTTVGGVVGEVDTDDNAVLTIEEITITGNITGNNEVGGIIGELDSDVNQDSIIKNVHLELDITGDSSVGGLVGEADTMRIEDSSYQGTLTADGDYQGGLAGQAYNVEISRTSTSGLLDNGTGYDIGGLVGESEDSTIDQSFSSMSSNEGSTSGVGGLVGYLSYGSTVTDSYARGNLAAGSYVGGLVGNCEEASITNSYSTGEASAEGDAGGLVGGGYDCVVTDSFWDTETSMQATSIGDATNKTTAEMKDKATFTDTATLGLTTTWNFTDTWSIVSTINDGYPCLQWHDDNCEITTDSDGVPASEENAAPNGGDANNDGTPDGVQNHVSSFVNPISNTYAVVEADAACELNTVSATAESVKAVQDSGFNYSSGLINFTADCGTLGYTTDVRLVFFDKVSAGLTLRKFNPTTNAYFSVSGATVTDTIIGGKSAVVVTYQIVDGGILDTDGTVNGVIVDPVGLAAQVVGVPNTGFRR